ncbi:MAG: DUF2970 domain-containing protein [Gammaproteobacteria bacterium]|nr:DUF2970 domain-containing protein [Gammaproteobacteria bacterium]
MSDEQPADKQSLGLFSVFKSVLAAGFGVQKEANREKDFQQGKAIHFIVAGLVGTVLFLLILWGIVQLVLMGSN